METEKKKKSMTRSLKSQILIYIVLQLCNVTFLHAPTFNF